MIGEEEIWVNIPQYYHYDVSNLGRVRNTETKKIVKSFVVGGYDSINLFKHRISTVGVHRLIMMGFVPNTNNYKEVNHKNGIKTDNRIENLEWCSRSQNQIHACKNRLRPLLKGRRSKTRKLDDIQILTIRSCAELGINQYEIAKYFNIVQGTVSAIKRRVLFSIL